MSGSVGPQPPYQPPYQPPGQVPPSTGGGSGPGLPTGGPPKSGVGVGTYVRATIYAIIVAYALLFVFTNRESISINFVFFSANVSMIFALLVTLVIGALLAGGAMLWFRRRASHRQAAMPQAGRR